MRLIFKFVKLNKKKETVKTSSGAVMLEFLLVVVILLSLHYAAWTLGISLLRYAIMVDRATMALRKASVTPTLFTGGGPVTNCQGFIRRVLGGDGCVQGSIAYELVHGAGTIGDPDVITVAAAMTRDLSQPVVGRQCRLDVELKWEVPCFFCHWFKGAGWEHLNTIKARASTNFEDPDFIYCLGEGCSTCAGTEQEPATKVETLCGG
ncbi:MAG: hypothetical protein GYA55_05925 [SAR324 cluster bacterium]|uniref:Uncharacterized protein n=1 Tax=SAR324 cluster bacterium TaxID=2024889 RepID=A0A7X9FQX8_9DELT|nr:hypothetical protein [SAR324 cluster bacterium]